MNQRATHLILPVVLLSVSGAQNRSSQEEEKLKCANLIYAVSKSSVCFSDQFLATVTRETNCRCERRFTPVRLADEDVFRFPFAIMTGEGSFNLTERERHMLKLYLTRGGFLLASAGCSSAPWDQSFRQEVRRIFPDNKLVRIGMDHPIFHTVFDIRTVMLKKGGTTQLEGLEIEGKIVLIYSPEGLNDTGNAGRDGGRKCCCCGGNEIKNSQEINVNIFTYALTH
ncbi:MAG: DUF4159 domain-containing protein [Sedimentisphaerales bacterium]|nr:DUF4159 domain-containing protein [Sedimentisphaerales bacterium]